MEFELNTLRSIVTVACLVTFVGIVAWAFSRRKAADFEQAAQLPFEQD